MAKVDRKKKNLFCLSFPEKMFMDWKMKSTIFERRKQKDNQKLIKSVFFFGGGGDRGMHNNTQDNQSFRT